MYLDETWVNSHHCYTCEWTGNRPSTLVRINPLCLECGKYIPSGKGQRLIILDAGSSRLGFISDVQLICVSKLNSNDYHDEMNGQHFVDWFQNTLIPRLPLAVSL